MLQADHVKVVVTVSPYIAKKWLEPRELFWHIRCAGETFWPEQLQTVSNLSECSSIGDIFELGPWKISRTTADQALTVTASM